uniref:cdc42 effector protein 4-like n=1 Tax=Myxine glutinosa TaxID=7769 RepID=UPI00358E2AC6
MFRQAKRRSRIDRNAISGPMGDFRHTMHIGRGGDAFGDTSFLATTKPVTQSASADPLPGADGGTVDGFTRQAPDTVLPVRSGSECSFNSRSSESLPIVNQSQINRTLNGHSKVHRNSGSDVESYDNYMCVTTLPAAASPSVIGDPMLSFDLDLGPSMLDDILSVMTKGSFVLTEQVSMESDVLQSPGPTCDDARPSRPKIPSPRQSQKAGGDVERELSNRRPERHSPSAPRNWNYDSGFESTTSPSVSEVRPQPKPRTVRTELVWEHGGVQKAPHRKVLPASHHLSSGSSVESGVTPWEDGRHKMSSESFDKASDEEIGEQFAFEDDDDDDEIRV